MTATSYIIIVIRQMILEPRLGREGRANNRQHKEPQYCRQRNQHRQRPEMCYLNNRKALSGGLVAGILGERFSNKVGEAETRNQKPDHTRALVESSLN